MNFVILSHLYSEITRFRQILYYEHTQNIGKEILASYGVRIQRGIVAHNAVEAVAAAKQLTTETGTSWYVKSQVHAGGRGKGGGVKLAKTYNKLKNFRTNYRNAVSYTANICGR
jgi:succinyl-CoA synthetase beta subunit